MKKLAYILAATFALFACAKEEIRHPSEAQAPKTAPGPQDRIRIRAHYFGGPGD